MQTSLKIVVVVLALAVAAVALGASPQTRFQSGG